MFYNKAWIKQTQICPDFHTYIERIDNHLNYIHQLRKGTAEIKKKIKNAKKFTRQSEISFFNIDEDLEEDQSPEEESDKMKMRKKETIQTTEKKNTKNTNKLVSISQKWNEQYYHQNQHPKKCLEVQLKEFA